MKRESEKAVLAAFESQVLGKSQDCGLGNPVGRDVFERPDRPAAGNTDDAAAALVYHARHHGRREQHGSAQIYVYNRPPFISVGFPQWPGSIAVPALLTNRSTGPEALLCSCHRSPCLLSVAHIGDVGLYRPARRGGCCVSAVFGRAVDYHHLRPLVHERACHRPADGALTTGNDRHLHVEAPDRCHPTFVRSRLRTRQFRPSGLPVQPLEVSDCEVHQGALAH